MRSPTRPALAGLIALFLIGGLVGAQAAENAPPRYPVAITDTEGLVQIAAVGVVADWFGYDGTELLYQVRATDMPSQDIVPVFTLAYLSGQSHRRIVELRVEGKSWGEIAQATKIDVATLNDLALPSSFRFTSLSSVTDSVMLDMLVCSALAHSLDLNPDSIMDSYRAGWHPLDVLTAAQVSHRTGRGLSVLLNGTPRDVDWYRVARDAGLDLPRMAAEGGRTRDSLEPIVRAQAQRSDLETRYALEILTEDYDVPYEVAREIRHRYLLSPSELVITFYLAGLGPYDPYHVARYYAWDSWRSWGPTIVGLGIPRRHFTGWSIWPGGSVNFIAVDGWVLHDALIGHALSYGGFVPVDLYYRFDPWFTWRDALFYRGVYRRYHVPFDDYYGWCRSGRSWRDYPHHSRDRANYRSETDILHGRRVGIIEGTKHYSPDQFRGDRRPAGPAYSHGSTGRPGGPGLIEGRKSAPPQQRYQAPAKPNRENPSAPGHGSQPVPRYNDQSAPGHGNRPVPRYNDQSTPRRGEPSVPVYQAPSRVPDQSRPNVSPGGNVSGGWSYDPGASTHSGGGPRYEGATPGARRYGEVMGAPSGYGGMHRPGGQSHSYSFPAGSPRTGAQAQPSWARPGGASTQAGPGSGPRSSGSGYGLVTGSRPGGGSPTVSAGGRSSGGRSSGRRR